MSLYSMLEVPRDITPVIPFVLCNFMLPSTVLIMMFNAFLAELGDFDEVEHTPAMISEFRFVPNQSEEMEVEIYNKYKSLR